MGGPNNKKTYAERIRSKIEASMKLNDTDRYVNEGLGDSDRKKHIQSKQLKNNSTSFYINHDALGNSRDRGENISVRTPVSYRSSYISKSHDKAMGEKSDSYEQRRLSKTEDSLKLSDTEHYANNDVKNGEMKEQRLAGQLKEKTLSPGIESYLSGMPTNLPKKVHIKSPHITEGVVSDISHKQLKKIRTRFEKKENREKLIKEAVKNQKALNNAEIKLNKQKIKNLKKEKNEIGKEDGKSQNVIGKGATAIRRSTDIVKNATNDMQDNKAGDDVIMERSYAMAGAVAKGAGNVTKGLVKASVSVASIEAKYKISSNRAEKNAIKEQIKEIKGVNQTLKKDSPKIYATHGNSSNEKIKKDIKYNKEQRKNIDKQRKQGKVDLKNKEKSKKVNAKANEKANRNAYIKDYTRKKIISGLIKPESDQENNMSTGFGGFVAGIAKNYMDHFFIGLAKWFLGIIGQVILTVISTLLSVVIFLMPIILPVGAVVAVICSLFSFLFGDISVEQANASYCVNVLNNYYNDFNKSSRDWLRKNGLLITGYKVVYVDDCSKVDNFQDTMLLYIVLAADNLSDGIGDGSYLVVDTDAEIEAMNKAFSMLTYAEVSGKVRNVHRLTLADVESQLTDGQKKILELERGLVPDNSDLNLGERTPGECPDDIGAGSSLSASENAQAAVAYALSKLGCPYSQALRNDGLHFDCSSLVYYAWLSAGVNISPGLTGNAGTTYTEAKYLAEVGQIVSITDYSELLPGDLIFLAPSQTENYADITHVVMYIGDNQVVHAPREGDVVKISAIYWDKSQIVEVARPQ